MRDYKDIGREGKRRRRPLRYVALVLIAVGLGAGGYAYRSHRLLSRAGTLAREGKLADARANLDAARSSALGTGSALVGLAGIDAIEGHDNEARAHLAAAKAYKRRASPIRPDIVLGACFARGDYLLARDVATFYWESGRSDVVDFYLGAAYLGLEELAQAQAALARVSPVSEYGDRSNRIKERIKGLETDPRRATLLDRQRRPLALHRLGDAAGQLELLQPALADLVGDGPSSIFASASPAELAQTHVLTIDQDLELLADAALGKYEGSLIVLSPETGEVLAYASHPAATPRAFGWRDELLQNGYEPGSIIKVSTYLAAIDAGVDMSAVFPLECRGSMVIEGKQFYDWKRHGKVADVNTALAESCNLAFAQLGMLVGTPGVREQLRRFGFDHDPVGPFSFGVLQELAEGDQTGLANMSIGLETLAATPMQVAIIAQALANGGVAMRPYVVRETLNVLDDRMSLGKPASLIEGGSGAGVATPGAVAEVLAGMRSVVESDDGTGRRARIDSLPIAIKTGTAGDRRAGLDAIMIAVVPADAPTLAIGLVAGHAGKAELEGARIIKDFVESALERGKIPGYEAVPKEGPGTVEPAP